MWSVLNGQRSPLLACVGRHATTQGMLHWWSVAAKAARELFPGTYNPEYHIMVALGLNVIT